MTGEQERGDQDRQAILNTEHLKLLSWGYFVLGGFSVFASLFCLIYVVMGIMLGSVAAIEEQAAEEGLAIMAWMFALIGGFLFVFMAALGSLKLYAGVCIRKRQKRTLCQVAAAVSVLSIPFGTILGVLTFIVLERPTVKEEFAAPRDS
ncbi:MAG: hypothetical protein GY719_04975 [bacterium]|nr:hypothetical protein [bacterium]